ncbi:hypothetical protein LTR10_008193 [Elasticomyces elasticus]|nr:hypothetical protein LTR10_008193 [Elasticomyces elasticus]KAK4967069.1 hypothetical protein LTR42_010417 [Elasticomyces elasticus]
MTECREVAVKSDAILAYNQYSLQQRNAIEKRLVRKLDTRIMPAIGLMYILNYLDRNSIAQARLYGLQTDTSTTGARWNTAIAILSIGYVGKSSVVASELYG